MFKAYLTYASNYQQWYFHMPNKLKRFKLANRQTIQTVFLTIFLQLLDQNHTIWYSCFPDLSLLTKLAGAAYDMRHTSTNYTVLNMISKLEIRTLAPSQRKIFAASQL